VPKPPVKCCIGFTMMTGFDTSKGKLVRRVIAHAENPKIEQKDGLWIILFLLICSIATSIYVLDQGLDNTERSKEKLFLRCILILTTVVPPELPMILNLAVNNSILYLQKKKIFVSEPKKIPLGGRTGTVAFDKTGTLTEDKFIFEGIVDSCDNYKELKDFKNCSNENNVVLAGCHSLISVDRELTGDPIELMFFQLSKW
jgi:manganese-transporting P-type ATPase